MHYFPMDGKLLNVMETQTEMFVLFTGQYLFLFSGLIPDANIIYEMGDIYMVILFVVISFNGLIFVIIVGLKLYKEVTLRIARREYRKMMAVQREAKRQLLDKKRIEERKNK